MGEARGKDVRGKYEESFVPRSKGQARQEFEHLERCHAEGNAAHDGNIVRELGFEFALALPAGLPTGKLDVCLYRLHECASIAVHQSFQRRESPPLRSAIALAAPTSLVSAAEQRERAVERVDEQPRQP